MAAKTCRREERKPPGLLPKRFVLDDTDGMAFGDLTINEFVEKNKHLPDEGGGEVVTPVAGAAGVRGDKRHRRHPC